MSLKNDELDAFRLVFDHSISYRNGLSDRPIEPRIDAAEAAQRFSGDLNEVGEAADVVIKDIISKGEDGLMRMISPRFFGYVIGASHPVGTAADMLSSSWAQVSGYAELTPTVSIMENKVCEWIINLLALPKESGAGIVTGATQGNAVAVMAARNALLNRHNWDVEKQGLFDAPKIHVVIGDEAHSATAAALRYAGLGSERVHKVKTNEQGCIQTEYFRKVIQKLDGPILVILQAGHINSGGFDPFSDIIPIARRKNAWIHVDGAFGLWVHAVPKLAHRLAGVNEADSWAVDLHKWLNAPYDAGMVITRDREPLVASMSAKGAYLPSVSDAWDPNDSTPELSRRARGVPSYAILRTLGKQGVRDMVTGHCEMAEWVGEQLRQIPEVTVLNDITCNQVAFYCGEGDARDETTQKVLKAIHDEGRVYPTHGQWRDGEIIRVSIIGHQTSRLDVEELVTSIQNAIRKVMGSA
jgi:glutamate/tyrosine decarboxylase-like PLP-dependent enzyme